MLAVQANGAEVTTIEGLAEGGKLHPLHLIAQAIKSAVERMA